MALQKTCYELLSCERSGFERRNWGDMRKGPLSSTKGYLNIATGPHLEGHQQKKITLPFLNNCVRPSALLPISSTSLKDLEWCKGEGLLLAEPLQILPLGSCTAECQVMGNAGGGGAVGCLSCAVWCTSVLKSLTSCCKLLSAHPHLTCEHKNSHVPGILMFFFFSPSISMSGHKCP